MSNVNNENRGVKDNGVVNSGNGLVGFVKYERDREVRSLLDLIENKNREIREYKRLLKEMGKEVEFRLVVKG